MRVFGQNGEIIDQALDILRLKVDDPGKLTFVVRVIEIEPLGDELRVVVILGKNDGLSQAIAAGHFKAARHQMLQHLVDGIFVEKPAVYRLGFDAIGYCTVVAPFERIPLFFFFFGQLVVGDPFALESQGHRYRFRRHEEAVSDRFVECVVVGRHAAFEVKQSISVSIDFVLRRCGEPDQQGIEILEDRAVLLVNRAVRLVDDDQIEVADSESALAVARLFDQDPSSSDMSIHKPGPRYPSPLPDSRARCREEIS